MSDTQAVVAKSFNNEVQDLTVKIDEMKPKSLLRRAKALEEEGVKVSFELGGVLRRIKTGIQEKDAGYKEYPSFEEYVQSQHHISISQANKMIQGYSGLVDKAIPYEKVAALPWSSLVAIIPALTKDNVDTLVAKAETLSFKEISALSEVKGAKNPVKAASGSKGGKSGNKSAAKPALKPVQTASTPAQDGAGEAADAAEDVSYKEVPNAPQAAPVAAPVVEQLTAETVQAWLGEQQAKVVAEMAIKAHPKLATNPDFKVDELPVPIVKGITVYLSKHGPAGQMNLINAIFSGDLAGMVRTFIRSKMDLESALGMVDALFPGKFIAVYDTEEEQQAADKGVEDFRAAKQSAQ